MVSHVWFVVLLIVATQFNVAYSVRSISVIGSNGKTGCRVVNYALSKGYTVNAVSRSGKVEGWMPSATNNGILVPMAGDVTKIDTLDAVLKGSSAAIFAASASKEGGSAMDVDKNGLINVAKACLRNKVPRLIIVSSGAVTKPWSPVYLFLNLFDSIMKAKSDGENEVRAVYSSQSECAYTIIRPGGLTLEIGNGVKEIELNQGDTFSGRISRDNVAALCIESLDSDSTKNVTYECYSVGTASPLSSVGLNNLFKRKTNTNTASGYEKIGSSYSELFNGLINDKNLN